MRFESKDELSIHGDHDIPDPSLPDGVHYRRRSSMPLLDRIGSVIRQRLV
jgi:hypothetical protein